MHACSTGEPIRSEVGYSIAEIDLWLTYRCPKVRISLMANAADSLNLNSLPQMGVNVCQLEHVFILSLYTHMYMYVYI